MEYIACVIGGLPFTILSLLLLIYVFLYLILTIYFIAIKLKETLFIFLRLICIFIDLLKMPILSMAIIICSPFLMVIFGGLLLCLLLYILFRLFIKAIRSFTNVLAKVLFAIMLIAGGSIGDYYLKSYEKSKLHLKNLLFKIIKKFSNHITGHKISSLLYIFIKNNFKKIFIAVVLTIIVLSAIQIINLGKDEMQTEITIHVKIIK